MGGSVCYDRQAGGNGSSAHSPLTRGFGRRLLALLLPRSTTHDADRRISAHDRRAADACADSRANARTRRGKVYLVGGGPGDPGLLTIRAAKLLASADVVVYDALVSSEVVRLIGDNAQRIYVGKQAGRHTLPQAEINSLLLRLAQEGRHVVRLKGGDPFIFGRGGEELEELAAAGIEFEVVPGITAASGMAAYAGIPLTHRDYAQACIFATGHLKDDSCDLDWPALARSNQTVVIYMGVGALPIICRELVAHGLPPTMPAALVQNATAAAQRSISGSLAALPELAVAAGIGAPALIVIGEVVRLQTRLQWFHPSQQESAARITETA